MNIFNSLARPYKLGRLGSGEMSKLQKCFFVENVSLFMEQDVHLYIFTFRYFLYASIIKRNGRLCVLINNFLLIERKVMKKEGRKWGEREREREREREGFCFMYIYFFYFTDDYFHILHTRNFASDRSIGTPEYLFS